MEGPVNRQSDPLLNLQQLAAALSVSYSYVLDARRAGMPLSGNRISEAAARGWLEANPDFRERARLERAQTPWRSRQ